MMKTFTPKGQIYGPIMPKWILPRPDVSVGAKLLYANLAACAAQGSNYCFPSQRYLAKGMGVAVRSVQNWLRELVALGLIAVKAKEGAVSRYYFLQVEDTCPSQPAPQPEYQAAAGYANHAGGYANRAYRSNLSNLNTNIPPTPHPVNPESPPQRHRQEGRGDSFPSALQSAVQSFEQIWELWPVKQAKEAALHLWKRLWFAGRLPILEKLVAKIKELQAKDRWWNNGKMPLLMNWLKGERWNDQPVPLEEPVTPSEGTERNVVDFNAEEMLVKLRDTARKATSAFLQERNRKPTGTGNVYAT